jgi:hypothetical protein
VGDMRNGFKILVEKPEGKKPLERLRGRNEGNIRMDLQITEWTILLRIMVSSGLLATP